MKSTATAKFNRGKQLGTNWRIINVILKDGPHWFRGRFYNRSREHYLHSTKGWKSRRLA